MGISIRDDIRLAAYAVSLGYTLHIRQFTEAGDPKDDVRFRRPGIEVALTSMGWRVFIEDVTPAAGQMIVTWVRPQPEDFHKSLKRALEDGASR